MCYMKRPGEVVEDISDYTEGGHHPIHLGDILHDRFEVIHKLGQGGFAIVWLCFDNHYRDWKAVKVIAADDSDEDGPDLKPLDSLRSAGQKLSDWEANHIVLPSEHFWVNGPNGRHLCLVLPLLGPGLSTITRCEPRHMTTLLLQAGRGLQYLHRHGICHGDFTPNNILLRLKDTRDINKDKMLELLGTPQIEELRTISGELPGPRYPKYVVCPVDDISCLGVTDEVAIVDFGGSFHVDNPPDFVGIPNKYAAPEARFRLKPGFSSDVWALACSMMEIRVGKILLGDSQPEYIRALEDLLGPLPEPYRSIFNTRRKKYWDEHGEDPFEGFAEDNGASGSLGPVSPLHSYEAVKKSYEIQAKQIGHEGIIRVKLAGEQEYYDYRRRPDGTRDYSRPMDLIHFKVPDEEVRVLGDLLESILKYDPKDRIDIDAVLQHTWFRERAEWLEEPSTSDAVSVFDTNVEEQYGDDSASSPASTKGSNEPEPVLDSTGATEQVNVETTQESSPEHRKPSCSGSARIQGS
ncbi:kinase-like protein [Xylariaceae sp. FL0662B]|nr:kinase-like protein [Xylariaceae sp. FL0662B]